MTRPDWCPQDVWDSTAVPFAATYAEEPDLEDGCECGVRSMVARAILAERERCRGVANERAAQLRAGIQLAFTDETKAGWAGQMIEALMIEQRISQGHVAKDAINIEGLHAAAAKAGFVA